MMRRMLGAPLGGTTRGGHHGLESLALSLIVPPNGIGGGGSCFPSSVMVALGEPGSPLICWADAGAVASASTHTRTATQSRTADLIDSICPLGQVEPQASPLQTSAASTSPFWRSTRWVVNTARSQEAILYFGTIQSPDAGRGHY